VFLQLHGEPVPRLVDALVTKGATVHSVLPYRHIPPETETLTALCREVLDRLVDAVCFTTAVQVRYLFDYAKRERCDRQLLAAFEEGTLAVAVGKVTAEALREEGLERLLVPDHERMGAMLVELGTYFQGTAVEE
jgi:uroporphyrinogen-III synthase